MPDEKRKTKGKLLFNDYQSPKYDRMRFANRVMRYAFGISTLVGFSGMFLIPDQLFGGIFLVSLFGFCFVMLTERSYRNMISVYENGLEVQCGKPRGGGSTWSVGRKFIPFSEIEAVFHGADPQILKTGELSSMFLMLIVSVKVRNKDYIGNIPSTSVNDVFPILKRHFGEQWKEIYKGPSDKDTNSRSN